MANPDNQTEWYGAVNLEIDMEVESSSGRTRGPPTAQCISRGYIELVGNLRGRDGDLGKVCTFRLR